MLELLTDVGVYGLLLMWGQDWVIELVRVEISLVILQLMLWVNYGLWMNITGLIVGWVGV